MKPIYQTIMDRPWGNCMQAAIASIMELSLEDVPNFAKADNMDKAVNEFLAPLGFGIVSIELNEEWYPSGYHLLCGETPEGIRHAVVAYNGKVVHDPHKGSSGLVTRGCVGVIYWLGTIVRH